MAILLSDDFTGTTGDIWNIQKWPAQRGANIQITANSGTIDGGGRVMALSSQMATDFELVVKVSWASLSSQYVEIGWRIGSATITGGNPSEGYAIQIIDGSGGRVDLFRIDAYNNIGSVSSTGFPTSSGSYWFKVRCVGSNHKLKWWADGAGEPGTWNMDVTDATYTRGAFMLGNYGSNVITWDQLTVTDLASPPTPANGSVRSLYKGGGSVAGFGDTDLTYCGWFQWHVDNGTNAMPFGMSNSGSTSTYFLTAMVTGTREIRQYMNDDTLVTGFNASLNTWYFLAAVRRATGTDLYYAPEGGSLTKVSGTGRGATLSNFFHILTGTDTVGQESSIAGVKLWTAALTQTEITAEMPVATAVRTANLWGSWPCNEGLVVTTALSVRAGTQAQIADVSGAGRHLFIGGGTVSGPLSPVSPSTGAPFVVGRMWDDENGTDSIALTTGDYTEVEWNLKLQTPATGSEIYQFRVFDGTTEFEEYIGTPQLTVTAAAGVNYNETGRSVAVTAVTAVSDQADWKSNVGLPVQIAATTTTVEQVDYKSNTGLPVQIAATTSVLEQVDYKSNVGLANLLTATITLPTESFTHLGNFNETGRSVTVAATITSPTGKQAHKETTRSVAVTATTASVEQVDLKELALSTLVLAVTSSTAQADFHDLVRSVPVAATVSCTDNQSAAGTAVTVMMSSSKPTALFGEVLTLRATVLDLGGDVPGQGPPGTGVATPPIGSVTFYDGVTPIGTDVVNIYGESEITLTTLTVATHSITATYTGTGYATTTSSAYSQSVVSSLPTPSQTTWAGAFATRNITTITDWFHYNTGWLSQGFNPANKWTPAGTYNDGVTIDAAWLTANAAAGKVVNTSGSNWTITGMRCSGVTLKVSNITFDHCWFDRQNYATVWGSLTVGYDDTTTILGPGEPATSASSVTNITFNYCTMATDGTGVESGGWGSNIGTYGDGLFYLPATPAANQWVMNYCEFTQVRAGIYTWGGATSNYCWVHDLDLFGKDPHNTAANVRRAWTTHNRNLLTDGTSSNISCYSDSSPFTNFWITENTMAVLIPSHAAVEVNFGNRGNGWTELQNGYVRELKGNLFLQGGVDSQYFTKTFGNRKLSGEYILGDEGTTPVNGQPVLIKYTPALFGHNTTTFSVEFTPSPNSTMLVFVTTTNAGVSGTPTHGVTSTGQFPQTFTKVVESAVEVDGSYNKRMSLWKAETGTSTSFEHLTATFSPDSYATFWIYEITGIKGMNLIHSVSNIDLGSNLTTISSGTLSGAAAPGNISMAFVDSMTETPGALGTVSSWNKIGEKDDAESQHNGAMYWRTDFAGTSFTLTGLGTDVFGAGVLLAEYTMAGAINYNETGRSVLITATTAATSQIDWKEAARSVLVTATNASTEQVDWKETQRSVQVTATTSVTDVHRRRDLTLSVPVTVTVVGVDQADLHDLAKSVPVDTTTVVTDQRKFRELALSVPITATTSAVTQIDWKETARSVAVQVFIDSTDLLQSPGHYEEILRDVIGQVTTTLPISQADFKDPQRSVPITATVTATDAQHYHFDTSRPVLITATTVVAGASHFRDSLSVPIAATTASGGQARLRNAPVGVAVTATTAVIEGALKADHVSVLVTATFTSTDQADFHNLALPITVGAASTLSVDSYSAAVALALSIFATVTVLDYKSRVGVVKLNDGDAIYVNGWADAVYVGATKVWP